MSSYDLTDAPSSFDLEEEKEIAGERNLELRPGDLGREELGPGRRLVEIESYFPAAEMSFQFFLR